MIEIQNIKNHWSESPFAELRDACVGTGRNIAAVLLEHARTAGKPVFWITRRFNPAFYNDLEGDLRATLDKVLVHAIVLSRSNGPDRSLGRYH